jgi:hypothetical protein
LPENVPKSTLTEFWWVYPLATWCGGAIAGFSKHILKGAHDSLKESDEFKYDLAASEDKKVLLAAAVNEFKLSLNNDISEELDKEDE